MPYVEVALPVPLFHSFTYEVSESEGSLCTPGMRVLVPFRNRRLIGVLVGDAASRDAVPASTKRVLEFLDRQPILSPELLRLGRWMARYYSSPLGPTLRSLLPSLLTGADRPRPSPKSRHVAALVREMPSLMRRDIVFARAPKQRELFELIESLGGRVPVEQLLERLRFAPSVLKGLVARGFAVLEQETVDRDPFTSRPAPPPARHVPTPAQRQAVDAILTGRPGEVFLLHGITGSGKTLVYLEVLRTVVESRGQSAIVLVPEIALTPQTVDRFRAVFGDTVAVVHSALSDGERYDAWRAMRTGQKRIAVGARSAIFAPLADLGVVVLDEEHETSYKQGEAPRYHAREVAMVRARGAGAVVVLGSATPSLESWAAAQSGRCRLLSLPERVGGATLPQIRVVDMRQRVPGSPASATSPLSADLEQALHRTLQRGEQSILLLNRRGYAAFLQCASCGDVPTCPDCTITLTYHRTPERLVCHYCQRSEPTRSICARCSGLVLRQRGAGTQQLERALLERFPTARVARMDVDTTSAKWAHTEILDRVGRGEVDILLGTQMIAKGLDFPNVTLVGVVDADVGINLPDFRASERCYQLLSQVAGRAGRGPKGGEVLIQTRVPEHHAVRCAVAHDYHGFVRTEYQSRIQPRYPPTVKLANVVVSGTREDAAARLAEDAVQWLRLLVAKRAARVGGNRAPLEIVGPAPCPVERIKRRWRWHLFVKADDPRELTRIAGYFVERFPVPRASGLRIVLDRDPVALL